MVPKFPWSFWAAALVLGLAPGWSAAQPAAPDARSQGAAGLTPGGAPERSLSAQGARIVAQGVPDKGIAACASCHGAQGDGLAASGFPRLAGQSPAYLVRQIESFAQDTRSHPLMSPIAKAMTLEENLAAASYYASLDPGASAQGRPPVAMPLPGASAAVTTGSAHQGAKADRGQRLASVGDEAAQIKACASCHGPGGAGEAPAYPYLAGQHASYLVNALTQWKSGKRRNDPDGQMQAIASRLSEADIAAVAAYYASQPPPLQPFVINSPGSSPMYISPARRGSAPAGQVPLEK